MLKGWPCMTTVKPFVPQPVLIQARKKATRKKAETTPAGFSRHFWRGLLHTQLNLGSPTVLGLGRLG
ncbi:MAG: hypothetical protein CL488_06495 [Acidobacteria bacterium]|nr:hypothetical protein [Acidobacteriota bacterium]